MRASGRFFAPSMWPAPYSPGSRTSTHQRVLAVDEVRRLRRSHPRPAGRAAHERPQQHAAGHQRDGDQQQVVFCESNGIHAERDIIIERDAQTRRDAKLVLLRHGESTWNRENRFTGWTDVDLSADRHRGSARRRPRC